MARNPLPTNPISVALVQASPVLFDRAASLQKVEDWTQKAVAQGAQLVLFPEAFIPCYPRGLSFGTVVGSRAESGRLDWELYYDQAIARGDESYLRLAEIARQNQVYLAIGIIERAGGTLYCALTLFSPTGTERLFHRKLKPTAAERIIWGEGRGDDLDVVTTELGKTGGLICWENMMPLARYALYEQGIELYLAPTADQRESWQASMRHIALEGRCFVLSCNQFVRKSAYPDRFQAELKDQPEIMSNGGSVIYGPLGEVIAGPLWGEEGIVMGKLDRNALHRAKLDFDVTGHYQRPDVFDYQYLKPKA